MLTSKMLDIIKTMEQDMEDFKSELYLLQELNLPENLYNSLQDEINKVNKSESVILDQMAFIKTAISTNVDNYDFSDIVKHNYSLYLESLISFLSYSVTKHNESLVKFIGTYDKYKWGAMERTEVITSV